MVEDSQGDNPGKEDTDWAHLVEYERNVEEKKFQHHAHGFTFFREIVVLFNKVDKKVYGDKGRHNGTNVLDELVDDVDVQTFHGFGEFLDILVSGLKKICLVKQADSFLI